MDTPKALALSWNIIKDENLSVSNKISLILKFDQFFGLDLDKKEYFEIPEDVKKLLEERDTARKEKNWDLSDLIREKIEKLGFEVKDIGEKSEVVKK